MFKSCFEVAVQLTIRDVTCPGVWLSACGEVHLKVQLFGRVGYTFKIRPLLPLVFNEKFYFSKVFCGCIEKGDVYDYLYEEFVAIYLIQVDKRTGNVIVLATYKNNLRDFLSPLDKSFRIANFSQENERKIHLRSTLAFPGRLNPILRLLTTTTVQKIFPSTYSCCPECYKLNLEPRRTTFRKNFDSQMDTMYENKPPFVVRKVDSKLLWRTPSFYRECPGRKTYCCISPHRFDDCAACRIRNRSPSPVRRRRHESAPKQSFHQTRSRGVRPLRNPEVVVDIPNTELVVDDEDFEQLRNREEPSSPRIKSPEVSRLPSPSLPPSSPQRYSISNLSPLPLSNKREKSPILQRPTFQERFGSLPDDVIPYRSSTPQTHRPIIQQNSKIDINYNENVDDSYEIHMREPHPSHYPHYSQCCCHECSHLHCPYYWRSRLGPATNPYNWYSFRHGLNCVYDDFYRKVYAY